jgi:hypothetical protein
LAFERFRRLTLGPATVMAAARLLPPGRPNSTYLGLIWLNNVKRAVVYFPKISFHIPVGFTANYPESATGTP